MKKIVATGTFDILHPGHVYYLEESKKLGDELWVIVAREKNVVHKPRPIVSEDQRLAMVQSLSCVDHAVLGDMDDMYKPIQEINPDIITIGFNQKWSEDKLKTEMHERGIQSEIVRIGEYCGSPFTSSTKIINEARSRRVWTVPDKSKKLTALIDFIKGKGGEAVLIPANEVVTGEWVLQKCLFGCSGYGHRFGCPPYTPTPSETKKVLSGYTTALLIKFEGDVGVPTPERVVSRRMTRYVQQVMYDLEQMAFSFGFYKALGYTGHQCGWCAHCPAKEKGAKITDCVNRKKMRPSMEAAGIDAYATCASVGWKIDILTCTKVEGGYVLDSPMTTVMLLLIE